MNDEQIVEYLRSRARVRPPMDLVASIADGVADVPQQRRSWFAPFAPAAGAVAAAAVVLLAAVLIGQGPDAGPSPSGGATVPPTTPEPTPSLTRSLLSPGETVTLDAVDDGGDWGEIRLTRGDDVGGYDDGSVSQDSFAIEVQVEYIPEREPDPAEFGRPDWALATAVDLRPAGALLGFGGRREATRPGLATYPGAIDIFTNPLQGWLLFEVSRESGGEELVLLYRPAGSTEAVAVIPVRNPGPAPEPVAVATPAPTPQPVTYVEKDGYPFAVIDHAEADELFATPDTCTNPGVGYTVREYTVTYPDAWFTNTEIEGWGPCTWFSPVFYDVEGEELPPPQVAIVLDVVEATGVAGNYESSIEEFVEVSLFSGNRFEAIAYVDEQGVRQPVDPWYQYLGYVASGTDSPPSGVLTATTGFSGAADYELNKAILDRIMALIRFGE